VLSYWDYVRRQRGTARIRPSPLLQSIDISCLPATAAKFAAVTHACWDRDGRPTDAYYAGTANITVQRYVTSSLNENV